MLKVSIVFEAEWQNRDGAVKLGTYTADGVQCEVVAYDESDAESVLPEWRKMPGFVEDLDDRVKEWLEA